MTVTSKTLDGLETMEVMKEDVHTASKVATGHSVPTTADIITNLNCIEQHMGLPIPVALINVLDTISKDPLAGDDTAAARGPTAPATPSAPPSTTVEQTQYVLSALYHLTMLYIYWSMAT